MTLVGDDDIFKVEPPIVQDSGAFAIKVKNEFELDFEKRPRIEFNVCVY